MRKLLLVTAMVLISASAEARQPRSLSLAPVDAQASSQAKPADTTTAETGAPVQPTAIKSAETVATDAPKFVERPPGVNATAPTTSATPSAQPQQSDSGERAAVYRAKASRSRRGNTWTEARIVGELHRHGIYW